MADIIRVSASGMSSLDLPRLSWKSIRSCRPGIVRLQVFRTKSWKNPSMALGNWYSAAFFDGFPQGHHGLCPDVLCHFAIFCHILPGHDSHDMFEPPSSTTINHLTTQGPWRKVARRTLQKKSTSLEDFKGGLKGLASRQRWVYPKKSSSYVVTSAK
jgi:hypothetical protein